ncbi:MAG: hypothetical protein H6Q69_2920 [Firmicutes bacterium]|nr:hypothetical protein [Bacillota bacterium]
MINFAGNHILLPKYKIKNLVKGAVYMEAEITQFWCGNDLKEHIIMSNGTIRDAKRKIEELGKNKNFLDFCRQD